MGGGRGTRLSPLTLERCKPAVPLAGKYRLVDIPISNCINSGYRRIYILTQFNSTSLHGHISRTYKFDHFSSGFVEILAAQQTFTNSSWYEGTADAVRKNLVHFLNHDFDYLVILSGDKSVETRVATLRSRWSLTERQTQVLSLLATGDQNKDIATKLNCAPRTVEVHVGVGKMTADQILSYGADKVVLATGSHWATNGDNFVTKSAVEGIDASLPYVCTPEQILLQNKPVGDKVLVVDCDGYFTGVSLAELLADRGKTVTILTPLGGVALAADVSDSAAVRRMFEATAKRFGRLDVLVNNAAVSHAGKPGRSLDEIVKSARPSVASLDEVRAVFETNVFGVIAVTQAMLPLLREAPAARIVNVSSTSGSLTKNSDPTNPHRSMFGTYSSSKTALNAITVAFASDLASTGIKVNAACPGFTATDLNNFQGTRTVQQGAREAVRLALLDANGPTGTFSDEDGPVPW